MRKYRLIAAILAAVSTAAGFMLRSAFPELIPILFLLILIPQEVLMVIQCCDVACNWQEFEEAVTEEACEEVLLVARVDEDIPQIPFVQTLRVMSVMLGINPDRAGPAFVTL